VEPAGAASAKQAVLFSKKNQKTFTRLVYAADTIGTYSGNKSFLVLFFKKELLAS
jgi:hypothetical protein